MAASPPLDASSWSAFGEELLRLHAVRDLTLFPRQAAQSTQRLVPGLFTTYNELNLQTGSVVVVFEPEEKREEIAPFLPMIHQYREQHPLLTQYSSVGGGDAQSITDLVPWEEWQQREIFREAFGPMGVGESLSFVIHSSRLLLSFMVLNRARPDFTPAERALCNLLRRHLALAFENAQLFTAARAAVATGRPGPLAAGHALLTVDEAGRLQHLDEAAGALLDRYFPGLVQHPRLLPEPVLSWLAPGPLAGEPEPLLCPHPEGDRHRFLRFRRIGFGREPILLLEESGPAPEASRLMTLGLSAREAEVLYWLTQGKSNGQVGEILFISTRTVEKHLERIYPKLGVDARGPAMCVAAAMLNFSPPPAPAKPEPAAPSRWHRAAYRG